MSKFEIYLQAIETAGYSQKFIPPKDNRSLFTEDELCIALSMLTWESLQEVKVVRVGEESDNGNN